MDALVSLIKATIANTRTEQHDNLIYHVQHTDPGVKMELKALLSQGNDSEPHTIVEIDFVKKTSKRSRRQRIASYNAKVLGIPDESQVPTVDKNTPSADGADVPAITIYNSPIYIFGKYKKFSREMTQTPLIVNRQLKTQRSVSDFTAEFCKFFGADTVKFMACGREDIDVRCTGGRPFILEIQRPKKNLMATAMEIGLSKDIDIVDCALVQKTCKDIINSDESCKFYNVTIFSRGPIKFEKVYNLQQKTPLRVLHRRANITRDKTIEVLDTAERATDEGYYYAMAIKASSGAYIKEWVNGDFGRTVPNLGADLLALDVSAIEKTIGDSEIIMPFVLKKSFVEPNCS